MKTRAVFSWLVFAALLCAVSVMVHFGSAAAPKVESDTQMEPWTVRVSQAPDGSDAIGQSYAASISADGRYVAFSSWATNLVPGDEPGCDTYLFDRDTQTIEKRVAGICDAKLSGDGRYLVFASDDAHLEEDTNNVKDVYVYDLNTSDLERVSVASGGMQANKRSWDPSISADGSKIAFASEATNLVPNDTSDGWDVYVHNRTTGETILVSVSGGGNKGNGSSWLPTISADGNHVAFTSEANNLVPNITLVSNYKNVYLRHWVLGTIELISQDQDGQEANGHSQRSAVSVDGRWVAFQSGASDLIPDDYSLITDVFVRDTQLNQTTRVTVDSVGFEANGLSNVLSISSDGRHVAFYSHANNLVESDENQVADIFVRDRDTDGDGVFDEEGSVETTRASVGSDGREADKACQTGTMSADGRYVAFSSLASNLVPSDTNLLEDVFLHDQEGKPQPWVKPDLTIEEVQIWQVQQLSNYPLVVGKPIAVHVVIKTDQDVQTPFGVRLTTTNGEIAGFFEDPKGSLDDDLRFQDSTTKVPVPFYGGTTRSLLFVTPDLKPTGASVTVEVTVDPPPNDVVAESNENNNSFPFTAPNVLKTYWGANTEIPDLKILLVQTVSTGTQAFSPAQLQAMREFEEIASYAYPAVPEKVNVSTRTYSDPLYGSQEPLTYEETTEKAQDLFREFKISDSGHHRLVVMYPVSFWDKVFGTGWSVGHRVIYLGPVSPSVILAGVGGEKATPSDTYNPLRGMAFSHGMTLSSKPVVSLHGLWIEKLRLMVSRIGGKSRLVHSFSGPVQDLVWIDPDSYQQLVKGNSEPAGRAGMGISAADPLLLVSGAVTQDDVVTLDPIYTLPPGVTEFPSSGNYNLLFKDAGDSTLANHSFGLSFSAPGPTGTITLDQAYFSFAVPYVAGTAKVTVEKNGNEIASRMVTPNPPTVQVAFPNGGETLSGIHAVSWTASDSDGDALFYAVHYSPDGGATWHPLATDLSEPIWDWDTEQSPGAHSSGRIKVIASDGFNTAEDLSDDPFSVETKAPWAAIMRPIPGAVFAQGTQMIFEGAAFDLEQGLLPDSGFTWASDQDGPLGNGSPCTATLSLGPHVITLTATDIDGLSARDQISVTVGGETRPDLSISAADILLSGNATICNPGWISALVRNVVTDTVATASFYDGDPMAAGELIGEITRYFNANAISETNVWWRPDQPGDHQIFVTLSDANPGESDVTNNQAMTTLTVVEGICDLYLPTILKNASAGGR